MILILKYYIRKCVPARAISKKRDFSFFNRESKKIHELLMNENKPLLEGIIVRGMI